MKIIETTIPDVKLIEPRVFEDERGFLFESFHHDKFIESVGYDVNFVQDNHSYSTKGVLRGLHYQLAPYAQGKLVRVVRGEVLDVVVDIRKSSITFGKWFGVKLSEKNKKQLWVPEGFAHGFLTISDTAEFLYKTTEYYKPEFERIIKWDDSYLAINWGLDINPVISPKDLLGKSIKVADLFA